VSPARKGCFRGVAGGSEPAAGHRRTVDRGVNGDDYPHLVVYHWVNGTPSCYECDPGS